MAKNSSKKAIVVGASSGIGRALAQVLAQNGYAVGLAARRFELLRQLQNELSSPTYAQRIDISQPDEAMVLLGELISKMGGMDLIVINSGINTRNFTLDWPGEIDTIKVNVSGFVAMANVALKHFLKQNSGHLVGVSSIAGLRGSAHCPSYNASKAFVSNYLEGLRHRLRKHNIYVTDIRPGLVDTAMIKDNKLRFWVSRPEGAAEQIFQAIKKKKKLAYITRRWHFIAWLLKLLPDWIYRLRDKLEIED
ncbi:MAG: SDR family NAD(P)-dependent oxidoreductase [Candidatus Omnitrophica bacterium]|nr:SDR family NAD(P)-dependent oxidoreductase [Candidatus Omnitrophota bacterium]